MKGPKGCIPPKDRQCKFAELIWDKWSCITISPWVPNIFHRQNLPEICIIGEPRSTWRTYDITKTNAMSSTRVTTSAELIGGSLKSEEIRTGHTSVDRYAFSSRHPSAFLHRSISYERDSTDDGPMKTTILRWRERWIEVGVQRRVWGYVRIAVAVHNMVSVSTRTLRTRRRVMGSRVRTDE